MSEIERATATTAEQLRAGLRRLGKAVVVITCWHEERRWAMTATAVSELSMDPPSLLVCVNKSASLHGPLTARANFCVNILHADHLHVSQACSGKAKGEERFGEGQWDAAPDGTPYLRDAQASFFCTHETHVEYGTHAVVIGAVTGVSWSGDVDPLIYLDGGYARAARLGVTAFSVTPAPSTACKAGAHGLVPGSTRPPASSKRGEGLVCRAVDPGTGPG